MRLMRWEVRVFWDGRLVHQMPARFTRSRAERDVAWVREIIALGNIKDRATAEVVRHRS